MKQFDINLNLDFGNVKLDKLYEDAQKNGNLNTKTTSSDVTRNYRAGETNTYGGVSSSETETMDLSSPTNDSKVTSSNINADPSSMTDSSNSNISEVSNVSGEKASTNINADPNASNSANNGSSVNSYNTSNNSGVNTSSSTSDLGMDNTSSNLNNPGENKDLDIGTKKSKPAIDGNGSSTSTSGSATGVNTNNMQSSSQSSTSNLDGSFDMPENSFENDAGEVSTSDGTIVLTGVDASGNDVSIEVSVDEYTNLLSSFGIIPEDINRVLNGNITLANLMEEIQSDTDNTRREKMLYATNLQAYGLEYTDIKDLEKEIKTQKQKLKELYDQRIKADDHEIDAVANFLYRLQNGEDLESIVTSQIVAWEYIDENGNKKYRYDDPYAAGNMDGITYTPYTFEEMYKDSAILKELKEHLTEQTYKPLFSKEEKTVHIWDGSAEQQEYINKLLENYGTNYDNREENVSKLDTEISELEEKVNVYDSIYNAIVEEVNYYLYNIDAYLHKEDFYENNSFNESALDTISDLQDTYKDTYVSIDSQTLPTIYITDKEDLVNVLSCMINGEGNASNGYLQVGQNMFQLSSTDRILGNYLKYLPYIDEDTKAVFNYIYNTEGVDKAYDFLNGEVYDELDKKWLTETTLVNEDFAREHPVISSVGSIVVTPFEGMSAFYYSMSSYLMNQKIRRANVFSAGDVWRSTVAQDIAKNSELLSFIYSTGMSMADSVALIGLTVATGGVGSAAISAATMGSRAYVSTLNEALERGLSDGEAIALSFSSAVVETAMENYSVSHLLNLEEKLSDGVIKLTSKIADKIENKTVANIITKGFYVGASAISQGFVEGEEESATELLNYIADIFIAKDLSNYVQTLEGYLAEGDDETTAWLKTMKDFGGQAIQAFIGGFASGVCFGAFGGAKTVQRSSYAIANDMYGKLNGETKAQKFAQVLEINRNQLQEFNDIADKKQRGETLTEAEEFFLNHGTIEMQIAANMKYAREAKIRGLIKSIREITQTKGINTGVPVEVDSIENFEAAAKDFAEGNKVLEELLLTSHKYNVDTLACCGGHIGYTKLDPTTKYNRPYIAFKMTEQFEKCLPTILETIDNTNYDIAFIKNTMDSGASSFVLFNQSDYSNDMFDTLNRVIENVMGNDAYITNVSENTNKMMEIYNYLKSNELSVPVQVEISKNISGVNSVIDYEMDYGSTCDKGSFDNQDFVEGISKVEDTIKSIDTKDSVEQLEEAVEETVVEEAPTDTNREVKDSVAQFREKIKELDQFLSESLTHWLAKQVDPDFDANAYRDQYISEYCEMQARLFSSDLSDLPFEAWEGFNLTADANHPLDLSKTHANIDFSLVHFDLYYGAKLNFQGCNIRNFDVLREQYYASIDGNTVSRDVMEQNPKYFLLGNFSEDFCDRFYNLMYGDLSEPSFRISDFKNLTSEQIDEFLEKANLDRILDYRDNTIVKALGFKKVVELYQYSADVYYDIEDVLRGVSFGVWDSSKKIDTNSFLDMISNCSSSEEIKTTVYDFLRKYIIENSNYIDSRDFSKEFIRYNSDLFLVDANVPSDVREAFFYKRLKMDDITKYWDAFKSLPIEYFTYSSLLKERARILGEGKLGELLIANRDIIEDITSLESRPDPLDMYQERNEKMFLDYIDNVDVEKVCKVDGTVEIEHEEWYEPESIAKIVKGLYDNQEATRFLIKYKQYIEDYLRNHSPILPSDFDTVDLAEALEPAIFKAISDGKRYGSDMALYLSELHPEIYLDESIAPEIREKFYNKDFTFKDFESNPELLQMFGNTNVAYGFSPESTWIASLYNEIENQTEANSYRLRVLKAYESIKDSEVKQKFNDFLRENASLIPIERIEYIAPLLNKVSYSNSSELRRFKSELISQILLSDNPINAYNKIERIFVKNNIPTIGKIYMCFKTLYENYKGLYFGESSSISPVLSSKSIRGKDTTIFADLIKANFGSNNRTVREYLSNIEVAYDLYSKIQDGDMTFDSLDGDSKAELTTFRNHLQTLYEQTLSGRTGKQQFNSTENVIADIEELSTLLAPNGNTDYYLPDRVVSMFCHFAGFDTLEDAKNYINTRVAEADARNRARAESDLVLEVGDYVKGVDSQYLANILQRGSVAKEFLGANASSDATPLDTDLSKITELRKSISATILETAASSYGSIKLILKNDDRFSVTRTREGGENLSDYDGSKLEAFYTGACNTDNSDHYGIRTGFASTDIDYILTEVEDPSIGFEIARNGFYIPVVDKEGKIIFTPKDYDLLRSKMQGLSYYDTAEYTLSDSLVNKDVIDISKQIEQSREEVIYKRDKINQVLSKALSDNGLMLKTTIDGDLSEGSVELLDTGSTGRYTNKPGDGDFDFMMRVDRSVFFDSERMDKLKQSLLQSLGIENNEGVIGTGDFRLKGVKIDDITVDIDITFVPKSDKISYSTDISLQDRLNNILEQHPEQYKYVVSNILLAKQVLKEGGVYKPNRGDVPQGGLGGVGVENWILQHGGSFVEAAESFVEAAKGKNFEDFKKAYQVWDFGENHMAEKNSTNLHDEFVSHNMSAEGYAKMVKVLQEYLEGYYASTQNSVENRLVEAINSNEGIDDIISEINSYTEENIPEGYSSVANLKEKLAANLIKSDTLSKLTNPQFYELIKDKVFLNKVLDTEKLSTLIKNNLHVAPRVIVNITNGLTNEEIIKMFDKPGIKEYLDTLTDEEFLEASVAICRNDSNLLIISENLRERLAKTDPKLFNDFLNRIYNLGSLLTSNEEEGIEFIDIILKSFGDEETMLSNPNLVKKLLNALPYGTKYKSYRKVLEDLNTMVNKHLCDSLVNNAKVSIPENGIIDEKGYFTIKYSIDGISYEYNNRVRIATKLNLLEALEDHYDDILAGKLQIESITPDSVKNALFIEDKSKHGLNVVTLEINGEVEKHLAQFSGGEASLLSLRNEKQIDSAKVLSIEPFIGESFDIDGDNETLAKGYKMTYKIDGKTYSHCFLPVIKSYISGVYIDSYMVRNNLYNATDIKIESIEVDGYKEHNLNINRFKNSEEIFSDDVYGGYQGNVREIILKTLNGENLTAIEKQKSDLLIGLIKKYYPEATDTDIKNIAKTSAAAGCGYTATANSFVTYMNSLANGAQIFKDKMGFDLYLTDGTTKSFNLEAIALDYYLYANKIGRGFDTIPTLLSQETGMNFQYSDLVKYYFESKGIKVTASSIDTSIDTYKTDFLIESMNEGEIITVGSEGFDLERIVGETSVSGDAALDGAISTDDYKTNVGGHDMLVTDMLENGDLIVSSWSGKYRFIPTDKTKYINIVTIKFDIEDVNTLETENISKNTATPRVQDTTYTDALKGDYQELYDMIMKRDPLTFMYFQDYINNIKDFSNPQIMADITKLVLLARSKGRNIGVSESDFDRLVNYVNNNETIINYILGFNEGIEVNDKNRSLDATSNNVSIQTLLDILTNDYTYGNFLLLGENPDLFDGLNQTEIADGIEKLLAAVKKNNYDLGLTEEQYQRAEDIINKYGFNIKNFVAENIDKYSELINQEILKPEVFIKDGKFMFLISEEAVNAVKDDPALASKLDTLIADARYFAKLAIANKVSVDYGYLRPLLSLALGDYNMSEMDEKTIDSIAKKLFDYMEEKGYVDYNPFLNSFGTPYWFDLAETKAFVHHGKFKSELLDCMDRILQGKVSKDELSKKFDKTAIDIVTLDEMEKKYNQVRGNVKGFFSLDESKIVVSVDDSEGIQTAIHEMFHAISTPLDGDPYTTATGVDGNGEDHATGLNECITELLSKSFSRYLGLKEGTSGYDPGVDALLDLVGSEILDGRTIIEAYLTNNIFLIKEQVTNKYPKFNDQMWDDMLKSFETLAGIGLYGAGATIEQKQQAESVINSIIEELIC